MKGAHGDPSRDGFARSQAGGRGGVEMNTYALFQDRDKCPRMAKVF